MKVRLLFILTLIIIVGCSQSEEVREIIVKNNTAYTINEMVINSSPSREDDKFHFSLNPMSESDTLLIRGVRTSILWDDVYSSGSIYVYEAEWESERLVNEDSIGSVFWYDHLTTSGLTVISIDSIWGSETELNFKYSY